MHKYPPLYDPHTDSHFKTDRLLSDFEKEVINDFWLALVSRETSLQGRREVLTGKAKFGIFGDGKELAQIAMAKAFRPGDYRAGYYRDQTLMMSLGLLTVGDFMSQMYSDCDQDPHSRGRQMNGHFATPFLDENGRWINHTDRFNISAGISCTGGQMSRAMGLAFASKVFRQLNSSEFSNFSNQGNEVCFCTIGDASTSEGVFWESINAAAVEQIPLVVAVWDDGYGISVPVEKQTTKGSISLALSGMQWHEGDANGIDIYTAKGWDYASLCVTFDRAVRKTRKTHRPALVHVTEMTQPQGHSTSGSHERYKSKKRLNWEAENDGIVKMANWLHNKGILTEIQTELMQKEARRVVREQKLKAWKKFQSRNRAYYDKLTALIADEADLFQSHPKLVTWVEEAKNIVNPTISETLECAEKAKNLLAIFCEYQHPGLEELIQQGNERLQRDYSQYLYSAGEQSALRVPVVQAEYGDDAESIPGYQVINRYFDEAFSRYPGLLAFGEDVGHIGDVNQGMAGLQVKYGSHRIFDTGIREWTIVGQGLGCAMRGLRPIAEIQYLDYLAYALPILTDDVATLRYRSANLQKAPLIVRTRGHRLEGIWHTGSPMGMLLHSLRGMYICVPRNMVQAAGMYNTLLQADDPAIVIECLNGYRLRELMPTNIDSYTIPLGRPEILVPGSDVTIVTYGSCIRVAEEALEILTEYGVSPELIDVQTLLPFDLEGIIVNSLKKTNKIIFMDEDVPGGATAFMMQQVMEVQQGINYLDAPLRTITAKEHRTPYGNDGDYYAKPQVQDLITVVYELVFETPYL